MRFRQAATAGRSPWRTGPEPSSHGAAPRMTRDSILIVNSVADDPFAIDVAHHFGQASEISEDRKSVV